VASRRKAQGLMHKVQRFQCSRLRLKGFGAASSVPRCRFASDGIFDRFQLLWLYFLTSDTWNLIP
jgi:hypothetical protein